MFKKTNNGACIIYGINTEVVYGKIFDRAETVVA